MHSISIVTMNQECKAKVKVQLALKTKFILTNVKAKNKNNNTLLKPPQPLFVGQKAKKIERSQPDPAQSLSFNFVCIFFLLILKKVFSRNDVCLDTATYLSSFIHSLWPIYRNRGALGKQYNTRNAFLREPYTDTVPEIVSSRIRSFLTRCMSELFKEKFQELEQQLEA